MGDSTINIDPDTSTVTATCETWVDATTEGAYNARASCSVYDGDGNLLYAQEGLDDGTGYAETTITFTGTPGTTYNVKGHHVAFAYLDYGEYYDQPIMLGWADDPFDFLSFTEDPEDYPDNFFLEGPGPEMQTRERRLNTADTHASATLPLCPTSIVVDQIWSQPLQNDYPAYLTGVGILSRMKVGPVGNNYAGALLYETVTPDPNSNTCPDNIKSLTDFPTITYSKIPFDVGLDAVWEGAGYPATQNAFYDMHVLKSADNVLGFAPGTSTCQATATQTYSCGGHPIATFTLTNTYLSGIIDLQQVTFVTTTKQ